MKLRLADLLARTDTLAPMPVVVRELLSSLNDDDADLSLLARKIAHDQIIAARVLRLANSPHYGSQRRVASIDEAVVVLGFNTLRTLVVAAGITGAFMPQGFDRVGFWRRSFEVATLARLLGDQTRLGGDLGFTCGLMHNLGELCVRALSPEAAEALLRGDADADCDFCQVGAALAQQWRFPEAIQSALRHHTAPLDGKPPSALAAILWLAQRISGGFAAGTENAIILEQLSLPIAELAGVRPEVLAPRLDELRKPDQRYRDLINA